MTAAKRHKRHKIVFDKVFLVLGEFLNMLCPNLREYAFKVAAENSLDVHIAILASNQTFSQIKHSFRMVESFDIDLFTKGVAALVSGPELLVEIGRHRIVAVKIDVTADAEMLWSNQFPDVIEMIEDVLDRRGLVAFDKHAHAGDADDAARFPNLLIASSVFRRGCPGTSARQFE